MARGLNKVMIIGNVGREPELRYTPNGTPVVNFSVAVGRQWTTPDGERHHATEWFNVVAWRELAEICARLLSKGKRVYIEGSLQTRSWEDSQGQRQYRIELVADQMILLDRPATNDTDEEDEDETDTYSPAEGETV
ncbi:single-strand DNA-binding protein [Ardenticatena maritima]|uniref:Single-stranded DNA-binding protein n=1 Tax=Ardenticatena maritima TaxID=872965 RepID=A0A0M9UC60_9CHLR|nr:single-stranded DNA-binding protein [Ardenticatena maritima]KPL89521.1 single-stranded DNA-binding protein [Ardenticatena maritima]GAP62578.1 single-strand DNA-binding protein [Ardenticatena maritima]